MKAVVVHQDLVTAWGRGIDACWTGLLSGGPAFSPVTAFSTQAFSTHIAALVPRCPLEGAESRVMRILSPLLDSLVGIIPPDTLILLATTTGEIDLLEKEMLAPPLDPRPSPLDPRPSPLDPRPSTLAPPPSSLVSHSRLDVLLGRVQERVGVGVPGQIVSAACASSTAAVAQAASLIAAGERDSVLVVACDAVTEFVYAGFASLMALDPDGARPFDKARKGLTVGEGAAAVWLMSEARARRENRICFGEVAGWGLSADANHMTGPSRDGDGLARAVRKALNRAGVSPAAIGSVSAHGTGTPYNDAMELKAFRAVFGNVPVPVYSIKGSIGHTMGAAGLIEMLVALKSLEVATIPPSANLQEVDPEADGWVSREVVAAPAMKVALSTNSGFGGVNAALVLRV